MGGAMNRSFISAHFFVSAYSGTSIIQTLFIQCLDYLDILNSANNLIPRSHHAHEERSTCGHWRRFLVLRAQHSCDYLHRFVLVHVWSCDGAQDQENAPMSPDPFPWRYPAAPIKESTLLVNSTKIGSYDYLSK